MDKVDYASKYRTHCTGPLAYASAKTAPTIEKRIDRCMRFIQPVGE